jgi:AbrB family looped-hinge helix DNA binding protein
MKQRYQRECENAKESIVAHMALDEYLRYSAGELPDEPAEEDGESLEEVEFDLPLDEELPEKLAEAGVVLSESEKDRLRTLLQDGIPIRSKQPELRPECARLPAAEVFPKFPHARRRIVRAAARASAGLIREPIFRYHDGMITTIDKVGRVVMPVAIREKVGLRAGAEIEVIADDFSVRLVPVGRAPRLVRKGKRLIARPTAPVKDRPALDVGALVEEERNRWPW